MGPRPTHLRLTDENDEQSLVQPPQMTFHTDLPSPRTGEIPPALSPLDAFAMQSRALARQFEQEQQNGRRISRLPPVMVQKELANRPDYFRSISGSTDGAMGDLAEVREETSPTSPQQGLAVTGGNDADRPRSMYPMFGHASKPSRGSPLPTPTPTPYYDAEEDQRSSAPRDYFGIPRASSPEPVDPRLNVEAPSPKMPSLTSSIDSVQSSQPRTLTNGSTRSQRSLQSERGLLPLKSPGYPKSPRSFQSIRSVPPDSGDEDGSSYNGTYASSYARKFSGGSAMSRPQSPAFTQIPRMLRSPSITSESSATGSQAPSQRPQVRRNFSRPMSSGGRSIQSVQTRPSIESRRSPRESLELPHRHTSGASNSTHPFALSANSSRQASQEDVKTPYATDHIESPVTAQGVHPDYFQNATASAALPTGAPSYTHTRYSLPRGRTVERNSIGLSESWQQHQFSWDDGRQQPPSAQVKEAPKQRLREDSDLSAMSVPVLPSSPICPPSPTGFVKISGARLSRRDLTAANATSRSRSANPDTHERSPLHRSSPSVHTESTDRTIRATPLHERASSAELTPDEHLEVGIQAHSAGHLQKSTYHLRLAANAGLPTAMLLYALACRHGWGMRPNQEDGVMWLRKAIDGSGLEVADVESTISNASRMPNADPIAEAAERRKRKAQFALAIYELGISYLNGWGCPKDKTLAVRCYEVAGNWGDADALAEAGYCYTQGVGCKKDLKKAAGLYRKAADLGMSMAGNSWIYKQKYMDDQPSQRKDLKRSDTAESVPKRSRGRSIWSRKKEKP